MRRTDFSRDRFLQTGEQVPREVHATVDEVKILAEIARRSKQNGLMVDVGAHHGSASRHFLPDWKVYAFEPDDQNREWLLERYGDDPQVVIDPRALSDEERSSQPFFTSTVSTGISSLSSFHESHASTQEVSVTTLRDAAREYAWESVDFLKVDTEGYDLQVLRGAHLDTLQPEFIVCEFEDRKTVPLGYTRTDLATFLAESGYEVWVSEWHPVVEYGRTHDWRRLAKWPCVFDVPDTWGNFVCFVEPADRFDIEFLSAVRVRSSGDHPASTDRALGAT